MGFSEFGPLLLLIWARLNRSYQSIRVRFRTLMSLTSIEDDSISTYSIMRFRSKVLETWRQTSFVDRSCLYVIVWDWTTISLQRRGKKTLKKLATQHCIAAIFFNRHFRTSISRSRWDWSTFLKIIFYEKNESQKQSMVGGGARGEMRRPIKMGRNRRPPTNKRSDNEDTLKPVLTLVDRIKRPLERGRRAALSRRGDAHPSTMLCSLIRSQWPVLTGD